MCVVHPFIPVNPYLDFLLSTSEKIVNRPVRISRIPSGDSVEWASLRSITSGHKKEKTKKIKKSKSKKKIKKPKLKCPKDSKKINKRKRENQTFW